jgi:uncharacterized membrane protein YuzA (DUF378 family)
MTALAGWENFYVIVGSSAGALIGLQFVVLTLIADLPSVPRQPQAGAAFATPTIIHFSVVLLLAAVISAPWQGASAAAVVWGIVGLSGIVYEVIVVRRMRIQTVYAPEFEDWLFHVLLPFAAYAMLAVSAYATRWNLARALFGVAAASLLLLFIGIHNAWDAVTYHVFIQRHKEEESGERQEGL